MLLAQSVLGTECDSSILPCNAAGAQLLHLAEDMCWLISVFDLPRAGAVRECYVLRASLVCSALLLSARSPLPQRRTTFPRSATSWATSNFGILSCRSLEGAAIGNLPPTSLSTSEQASSRLLTLYHGIPEAYVGATVDPIKTINAAIRTKDGSQFAKGFSEFTAACNACHQVIGSAFIVIQLPTTSPFSDQSFAPPKKPR